MRSTYITFCQKHICLVQEEDAAPSVCKLEVFLHVVLHVLWVIPNITWSWLLGAVVMLATHESNLPQVRGYKGFFV